VLPRDLFASERMNQLFANFHRENPSTRVSVPGQARGTGSCRLAPAWSR
jgi:hypothetical protein